MSQKYHVTGNIKQQWVLCMFQRHFGAEIILSADETSVKFHETTDMVLVLTEAKNIGTSLKTKNKAGCTVNATFNMISNRALSSFLLFAGNFGERLT